MLGREHVPAEITAAGVMPAGGSGLAPCWDFWGQTTETSPSKLRIRNVISGKETIVAAISIQQGEALQETESQDMGSRRWLVVLHGLGAGSPSSNTSIKKKNMQLTILFLLRLNILFRPPGFAFPYIW